MAIQITRLEHSPAELRHMARVACDPDQARRLLAIAQVLDGASRTDAAKNAGMERQTLPDWVHRFNAEGAEGLKDRPHPGRKPLLDEGQLLELDQVVDTQPDPVKDGRANVYRERQALTSRCRDLKVQIKNRFDVEISERSVGRILRKRKFRRLSPRPVSGGVNPRKSGGGIVQRRKRGHDWPLSAREGWLVQNGRSSSAISDGSAWGEPYCSL